MGICGFDSANWILTFYAVQKLGAIACLISVNLGADEMIKIARAGDVTHICCGEMTQRSDRFLEILTSNGSPIEKIYDISKTKNYNDRACEYEDVKKRFEGKVEADDACVMVYTSGSTGVPKGVLLSAYNILNAACSNAKSLLLTKEDKACLMLPLFHIFGLVAGCFANAVADTLTIIPPGIRTDDLLKTIYEEKCTVFHSVPTMLLAIVNNKDFSTEKVSSLRSTILSGALASPSQVEMLMKYFPNDHFAAAYGLSEMAPVSITDYEDPQERIMHTIGKPIEGIDIRIYDNAENRECPVGRSGEIQVQGFNLMSCYYKADLDLQSIDEDGWLHTGDIGYMDEDGYLHFTGRIKDIIIRAGENIYPAEVAEAISSEEGIANVIVAGVPDNFWGENVAAALILKEGYVFSEEKIKESLSSKLARFKIPRYFFIYDRFPALPNGKVDMVTLKKDLEMKAKSPY
ncbi:MAG: acyl--CoA ligase [Saccharofermentans sp.]|nr:acyl--CoA ligase [Saccharofermentans sp.]